MPPKKKKITTNTSLKRPLDPLGNHPPHFISNFFNNFDFSFLFTDDILRQNLFLNKFAKSAEHQARPLGKFKINLR